MGFKKLPRKIQTGFTISTNLLKIFRKNFVIDKNLKYVYNNFKSKAICLVNNKDLNTRCNNINKARKIVLEYIGMSPVIEIVKHAIEISNVNIDIETFYSGKTEPTEEDIYNMSKQILLPIEIYKMLILSIFNWADNDVNTFRSQSEQKLRNILIEKGLSSDKKRDTYIDTEISNLEDSKILKANALYILNNIECQCNNKYLLVPLFGDIYCGCDSIIHYPKVKDMNITKIDGDKQNTEYSDSDSGSNGK
jgi:hypothetical protein